VPPPEQIPSGLERLSSLWTAPLPDYAPAFMHNESFGYILSAILGVGLILIVVSALSWLYSRAAPGRAERA
jgi:cobalt/nickel transport system permease protein